MAHRIKEKQLQASGKWIALEEITYTDATGTERKWESVMRTKTSGAVAVIAEKLPSRKIILIRQFRPPAENYVIEFPAGLIDEGETASETARREMREETGFICSITDVFSPSFSSPGLTGESVVIVKGIIDESIPENSFPQTDFDDGEDIETFEVPIKKIGTFIRERIKSGDKIDSKVMAFLLGLETSV